MGQEGTSPRNMSHASAQSIIGWSTQCVSTAFINTTASAARGDYHHMIELADQSHATWTAVSIVSLIAGLLLCFAGYQLFYLTIAAVGFLAGLVIVGGVVCGASNSALAAIIVGLIGAAIAAGLTVKAEKIGVLLVGAAGGFASYLYLNAIVLSKLYDVIPATHQTYTPLLICVVLAVFGACLAGYMEKYIVIGTTAIAGAYMMGFGIDRLAFANQHHNLNPLVLASGGGCKDTQCYGVLVGIVVVAIIGYVVQLRKTSKDEYKNKFSKVQVVDEYSQVYFDPEANLMLTGAPRRVSREGIL